MTIGIICEYNPFHNGHIYHLKKIKKKYPNSLIILVMSGNITQRGDVSIINKWDKTEIALKYGVDLVVELPFIYAAQSADMFAKGAMQILNELKVNMIVFGSEMNDKERLINLAKISLSKSYENNLVKYLKKNSYAIASAKALQDLSKVNLNTPNDILGLCYIKEIIKNNYHIEIDTIKRTNDYHSTKLEDIASATSIRNAIKLNKDISKYVPLETIEKINSKFFLDNYFHFIKYKIISCDDLTIYNDIDEKLASRLKKYILTSNSLEEYINYIKSKNYTFNRIKRILVYILVDFKKFDNKNINYIRILGFNKKGQKHLNKIKKDINLPVITNYSNSNGLLTIDNKINSILSLIMSKDKQHEYIKKEIKEVIRKID